MCMSCVCQLLNKRIYDDDDVSPRVFATVRFAVQNVNFSDLLPSPTALYSRRICA